MSRLIYLDNAATTKTAPEVVDAMIPYFTEHYGNPSSVYSFASGNKEVVSRQREIIAQALGAQANEIYFTAGGSESDNWALKATAEAYPDLCNVCKQRDRNDPADPGNWRDCTGTQDFVPYRCSTGIWPDTD